MTVLITLAAIGTDAGPFDLYSNLDGFTVPFEENVAKSLLIVGYSSSVVPDYATTIRVQSKGNCVNYVDIILDNTTTTTTSTSSSTTTTTTTVLACLEYTAITSSDYLQSVEYTDCYGEYTIVNIGGGTEPNSVKFCALENTVIVTSEVYFYEVGACPSTTTTTSSTSTTTSSSTTTTTTTIFTPLMVEATMSEKSSSGTACSKTMPNTMYVFITSPGIIVSGNFVYNDMAGTSPFIGANNHYRISIVGETTSYNARINSSGQIFGTLNECI